MKVFKNFVTKNRPKEELGGFGYSFEQAKNMFGQKVYIQVITAPQDGEGWSKLCEVGSDNEGNEYIAWINKGAYYKRNFNDVSINRCTMGIVQRSVIAVTALSLIGFGIYKLIKK